MARLRTIVPDGATLAQLALRWILMFDAVTCAIPGAKTEEQARDNALAASLPPLDERRMSEVRAVYDEYIRPHVHAHWWKEVEELSRRPPPRAQRPLRACRDAT